MPDYVQMELIKSTSFVEDSPVKILALPVSKQESQGKDQDYGQKLPVLLAKYDPSMQSWKTLQTCLLESGGLGLDEFSETWPRSGIMQNGIAYQLPTLVPLTDETEFGLLPTPRAYQSTTKSFNKETSTAIGMKLFGKLLVVQFHEVLMGFPPEWTGLDV